MISSLSNFSGIQKEADIAIITLDDNIVHTYCSSISWQHDNASPVGIAKLIMPYTLDIEKYWVKYSGGVVVHANLNNKPKINENDLATMQQVPNKSVLQEKTDDKIRIQNDEYNYSFIGKVHRFRQEGKKFVVYLENIGWKFLQKVPKEFRQTYIAGQTLANAFQAICEFMGVEFAYSVEKLNEYNFAADGHSVEKDGKIIENVETILSEYKTSDEEEEDEASQDETLANALDDETSELPGLVRYNKKKADTIKKAGNQALNALTTNPTTGNINDLKNKTKTEDALMEDEEMQALQEEFDSKIEDLFKGNTLYNSNISDAILNYEWITVTPTAQATETPTTDTATTDALNNQQNEGEANNDGVSSNNSTDSQLNAEN